MRVEALGFRVFGFSKEWGMGSRDYCNKGLPQGNILQYPNKNQGVVEEASSGEFTGSGCSLSAWGALEIVKDLFW